ncbi:MAG: hypothetical protein J5993_02415 [Clostridia bacterium]|nr:hypothetical protein [Clostridia bacterium]
MTELESMLQYQEVDGKLRALEQEIASSDERKKYFSAKKFLEKASEKLEVLDNKAVSLEKSAKLLTKRYVELAKSLDDFANLDALIEQGADISFYKKQAQALSEQLRGIKAELNQIIASVNAIQKDYASLKQQTITAQKQFKEYRVKYNEVKEGKASEMEALETELKKLEKGCNREVIAKYKAKRKEHIFPVFGELRENRCPFCGMDLPIAMQSRLAEGKMIECDSCHRFIYTT